MNVWGLLFWICSGLCVLAAVVLHVRSHPKQAAALAASAAVLVGVYYLLFLRPVLFKNVAWKEAASSRSFELRRRMVADLRRLMEAGAIYSKETALEQLGPPERGSTETNNWRYDLGPTGLFPIDDMWLDLSFDEKGSLKGHAVRPD